MFVFVVPVQGSSLLGKFDTGNIYSSLDGGEEAEDVRGGDDVGLETDAAVEEAHAGSGVGNGVETQEPTTRARSTASHVLVRRGVEMIRTALWTVLSGLGGVIGRIATGPFGRVETENKRWPVRTNS